MEGFAVAPPGFTDLVEAELKSLGLRRVQPQVGGVSFKGRWADIYNIHLHSRVTGRVLVRMARFFAPDFRQLEKGLHAIDWPLWVAPGSAVSVHCSTKKTRLYHSEKLTELVLGAVSAQLPIAPMADKTGGKKPTVALYLRIKGDKAMVSFDATGEHLHKRGYRSHAGNAPLRENLAAGLLLRAGYNGSQPLLDPCCGSGTFPVEAALIARNIAPGRNRRFAFEQHPGFDPKRWEQLKAQGREEEVDASPAPIFGADIDPEAVQLAARTARAAGVGEQVQVAVCDMAELTPDELLGPGYAEGGLLIANPPYGQRLAGASRAYGTLSTLLDGPFQGWRWGVIVAEGSDGRAFRCEPQGRHRLVSGGLSLEFQTGGGAFSTKETQ